MIALWYVLSCITYFVFAMLDNHLCGCISCFVCVMLLFAFVVVWHALCVALLGSCVLALYALCVCAGAWLLPIDLCGHRVFFVSIRNSTCIFFVNL